MTTATAPYYQWWTDTSPALTRAIDDAGDEANDGDLPFRQWLAAELETDCPRILDLICACLTEQAYSGPRQEAAQATITQTCDDLRDEYVQWRSAKLVEA